MSEEKKENRFRHRAAKQSQRHGPMHGGPGGAIGRPVEKAKNFKTSFIRLAGYLKPMRIKLFVVLIFAVLSTVFTILSPKIMGIATNKLTDGVVAKMAISQISKMQSTVSAQINKQLTQVQQAEDQAVDQAKATVKATFDAQTNQKLQEAENAAIEQAKATVKATFDAQSNQKLKDSENAAAAQAKATADAQFDSSTAEVKKQQETDAANQARQATAGQPQEAQDSAAQKAVAAVDQSFDQQRAAAEAAAVQQAKAAVEQAFAQQQPQLQQQLAAAQNTAAQKAKDAVDQNFAQQQPQLQQQLEAAQSTAADQAKAAVEKQVLEQGKLTSDQWQAMKELASMPNVSTISDANQKADTIRKLIDLAKKMPSASTGSAASTVNKMSSSDINRIITDVRETNGKIPFDIIGKILFELLGIYLLSALFTFVMQFIMSSVAQNTVYSLRRQLNSKLAKLPLKYFDSHPNGEVLSRMTNDIDTISSTLQQSLTQLIQSVMQLIGYTIMMLTISPLLTLIVILTLPLYILTTMMIAKHSQKFYSEQQKYLGELSGHTEEMFTGHKIVKAFGHEQESIETFEEINDELYNVGWKAQFMSGIMYPLMNFISNIGYVLITVFGGIFVTKTWLNVGDITAFIQYSKQFSMPIIQTANIANIIQSTIACAERVFEVLDEEEEVQDPENAKEIHNPEGAIKFDHVQFSYRENQPLMQDMNLDVKPGETIAIVGPTGAGKTTLVNLLMRFYEIQGGKITFDGVNIRDLKRGSLRTMFGMVLQDTWLFKGTIHDNIAYGRENATETEIVSAAKAAHADHFIRSLPDGYNTILNEEASNISQGQKQLLTIARALLADPAVLILDEATSSVDTRTEVLIQKAMSTLMRGRTNFVIAHRLSTIRDANMILVMNHGTIIEKGNHHELLEQGGFYADLYNSQFTGAAIDEQAV